MEFYARQGDLIFNKLPGQLQALSRFPSDVELKPTTGLSLAGSDSDPHTVVGPVLAWREGRNSFIRLSAPTEVLHAGRHVAAPLEAGDYEVYPLRERGDQEDRVVTD